MRRALYEFGSYSRPWEYISMDYLIEYPTTKNQHDPILLVVDIFSKMDIIIPCKKTTTTQHTAQLFFEHVWKHFGLPMTIISDRDSIFVITFWKNLWQQIDTRLSLSTAFHPQTYGHMEIVNFLVIQLIRIYNHKN